MRVLLRVVVLSLLFIPSASAQDTGGSFGGGSWDSGGGGGGGGDYSYSGGGGGGYDYSSSGGNDYSYSGGGGSGGGGATGGIAALLIFGTLFVVFAVVKNMRSGPVTSYTGGNYVPTPMADITVLRFGLDARVRPFVQKELDRIAKTSDTRTPEGLLRSLNEVALLLRRVRDTWVYGGAHNEAMSSMGHAQSIFQKHVSEARSTFKHELVRASDGQVTTADSPHHVRRTEEGPGIVLVTLVVAAKQELFTVNRIGDGDDLRRALEVLSALTSRILVAMEVIWTPADPDDRMSSVELEQMLPDAVFPIRGAMVGKVICSYCGGPFPQELMTCPHCGAPARDSQPAQPA